jgi:hypothetical protein
MVDMKNDKRDDIIAFFLLIFVFGFIIAGGIGIHIDKKERAHTQEISKLKSKVAAAEEMVCLYHYGMFGEWPNTDCRGYKHDKKRKPLRKHVKGPRK